VKYRIQGKLGTNMKEKPMSSQHPFTQVNFCAALLRGGALVFLLAASAAYADPVTLSCRNEANTSTTTFRINYANGLLEQLNSNGDAYNRRSVTATISSNTIVWSIDQPSSYLTGDGVTHQTTEHWQGQIDRLAASGWMWSRQGNFPENVENFTCRQATQKF
jgi:hypothetical protein